jgi:hypothetical protein
MKKLVIFLKVILPRQSAVSTWLAMKSGVKLCSYRAYGKKRENGPGCLFGIKSELSCLGMIGLIMIRYRDRNWLEFLSVLDGLFPPVPSSNIATGSTPSQEVVAEVAAVTELFEEVATADGRRDRSGLLALIELEQRTQIHGLSKGLLPFVHVDSSQPLSQTNPEWRLS